ncbi:DUF6371 domain-containing protein [Siphonobacter sp. SORGH_AS_1065]|uniref:DUF6371 domain-containing protein n=1 Tax=Siphonobacter sp. SORGH_AS_1065 TaxID=3041795 RepID=UPI002782A60C|nr:DUF6371 domain-containing protein [Siphonobacter sp. SORGH_AS_1065]MDQ1089018.1 hypothetical protein [Siphonobacter sp. SORGH_AS_1065]
MSDTIPFRFERHPKKKGTCPGCGGKGMFRFYEDLNGNRLSEDFGKCDRTAKCGYFAPPSGQVFESNPDYVPEPEPEIVFPEGETLKKITDDLGKATSNFHAFARKLTIPNEHLEKWLVGTNPKGMTSFVMKNRDGQVMNVKWIRYNENGKRGHDEFDEYSLKQLPPDSGRKYGICLYGEHLLTQDKAIPVCLVESEKTAVLASFFYPSYTWLACGSANGLTAAKITALIGRKVYWLADADKAGRQEASSLKNLVKFKVKHKIVDLFPERNDGWDIADGIVAGLRPDLKEAMNSAEWVRLEVEEKPKQETPKPEKARRISTAETSVIYDTKDKIIQVQSSKNWVTCCDGYLFYLRYVTEDEQENVSWIIEFLPINEKEKFTLELTNKEFLSPDSFDEAIASRGLALNGGKSELKLIRTYNFQKFGVKKAVKVIRFGYHESSNTYFFSNKAFNGQVIEPDENNIIHTNDMHVVLPSLNDDIDDRFILTPPPISFNQWFEIYVKAYLWDNAFLPVCFYLTSLFRDIALSHNKIAPLLYVYGVAGTGKSSVLRSLTNLFGKEQPEINLKADNTDAVVPKMISLVSNGLVQFDEMTDDSKFQGMFQASYDNIGRMRTPDNARGKLDFESIEVKSLIMLTANHMPKYQPFLERCLFMINNNKKKTEDQRRNWEQLKDLGRNGLAGLSVELLHHRDLIKKEYPTAYNKLLRKFKSLFPGGEIYERNFNNVTQLLTVAYILKVNGKIDLGMESVSETDVLEEFAGIAYQQIIFQHRILSEKSALSEFMEMVQWLYDNNKIFDGIHFRFDGYFVMFRFSSIYTTFKQQYYFQYQQPAPTKDAIEEEIIQFETPRSKEEIFKGIRFRDPDNPEEQKLKDKVNHSCVMTYDKLVERFGLDLTAKKTIS